MLGGHERAALWGTLGGSSASPVSCCRPLLARAWAGRLCPSGRPRFFPSACVSNETAKYRSEGYPPSRSASVGVILSARNIGARGRGTCWHEQPPQPGRGACSFPPTRKEPRQRPSAERVLLYRTVMVFRPIEPSRRCETMVLRGRSLREGHRATRWAS